MSIPSRRVVVREVTLAARAQAALRALAHDLSMRQQHLVCGGRPLAARAIAGVVTGTLTDYLNQRGADGGLPVRARAGAGDWRLDLTLDAGLAWVELTPGRRSGGLLGRRRGAVRLTRIVVALHPVLRPVLEVDAIVELRRPALPGLAGAATFPAGDRRDLLAAVTANRDGCAS
jgi:hypothetical protein